MQKLTDDVARRIYWDYFQKEVEPVIREQLRTVFAQNKEAVVHLTIRLSSDARFKPSELTYWMLRDLCATPIAPSTTTGDLEEDWAPVGLDAEFVPSILAAVELVLMGRLVCDDILDNHTLRQNFRALHAEVGRANAWLVGSGLQDAANELLLSLPLRATTIIDLINASMDYSRRLLNASLFELRFSPANLDSVRKLDYGTYHEHMREKHGIGQLSGALCQALAGEFGESRPEFEKFAARIAPIMKKLSDYDVAGGVDNDWSEFSGRRGADWERIEQKRGRKSEVQLGRPTIWNLFLQDAPSIKEAIADSIVFTEDLATLNLNRDDPGIARLVGLLVERLLEELLSSSPEIEETLPLTAAHLNRLRVRKIGTPRADALVDQELGDHVAAAVDSDSAAPSK